MGKNTIRIWYSEAYSIHEKASAIDAAVGAYINLNQLSSVQTYFWQ